jgi:hypothetical protein
MNKYKIEVNLNGRTEGNITSEIQADSQRDADEYAQALANMMPARSYNIGRYGMQQVNWYGYATLVETKDWSELK